MTPSDILKEGFTAKGSSLTTPDELFMSLEFLRENTSFVHSIEAWEIVDGRQRLSLGYSILGLDDDNNWEQHYSVEKMFELVKCKITEAKKCKYPVMFQIWLDEFPTDHDNRAD